MTAPAPSSPTLSVRAHAWAAFLSATTTRSGH